MKIQFAFLSTLLSVMVGVTSLTLAQDAVPDQAPTPVPVATPAPAPVQNSAPTPAQPAPEATPKANPAPTPAPTEVAPVAKPAPTPAPGPRAISRRGMLPMGFRDVITNEQRDKIYEIQKKYRPRMEELEAEMVKVRQEMRQEIETVLTQEQLQKVRTREQEIRNRRGAPRP